MQRLRDRREPTPFPEEPGQCVVNDAFVAAVAVGILLALVLWRSNVVGDSSAVGRD